MDALAVVYVRESVRPEGRDPDNVPGAFRSGTNHFAHAGSAADAVRAAEYEVGPSTGFADLVL
jgi:hypothetical protein